MVYKYPLPHTDAYIEANIVESVYNSTTHITVYICRDNEEVYADERHTYIEVGSTTIHIDTTDRQAVADVVKTIIMHSVNGIR